MAIKLGGLEVASTSDLIVGGGAYAAGFAIDAFLFPGEATSSEVAGAVAIAGLAGKYAVQVAIRYFRPRRDGPKRDNAGPHSS